MTDYRVGDEVEAVHHLTAVQETRNSWGGVNKYGFEVEGGTLGRVTSVRSAVLVRVRFQGHPVVGTVDPSFLRHVDESVQAEREAARAEREARAEAERLATEPKEGDIMPDDPRLAWLWTKLGKYATKQNFCSQYDDICEQFGIPGRERSFRVNFKLSGVIMSTDIAAHSLNEAREKVVALVGSEHLEFHNRETSSYIPYIPYTPNADQPRENPYNLAS